MKKLLICLAGVGIIITACSKGNSAVTAVDCTGEAKSFVTDVSPVIQANCTSPGCHNSGSNNGPGALITYQQIFNARISIRAAVASGSMPQGGSLSASQKNTILCWIDNGGANN